MLNHWYLYGFLEKQETPLTRIKDVLIQEYLDFTILTSHPDKLLVGSNGSKDQFVKCRAVRIAAQQLSKEWRDGARILLQGYIAMYDESPILIVDNFKIFP